MNSVAAAAASAETAEISRQLSTVIPALPTFRDRVEALHELVTKHPEAKIEGDARQLLRKWLKTGIVEKAAPIADPDTKEAEKNDGTLYIGIFETSVGYIKYWRNKEEHRDLRAYQTLHPEDLVGKPGPLTPVKLTEQYAVARDALLQEADSSEAWKQFAVIAKRLQQDLDAYVQQGGNGMGANFRNSADFARDVNGIWSEHIQPLFR